MTKRLKFKLHLHRIVIVLFCLALLAVLIKGAAYFSANSQAAQVKQSQELARTLAKQVTFTLAPLLDGTIDTTDDQQIRAILQHLTQHSRVLDASVYKVDGTLIVQEGDKTSLKDRLAIEEGRPGSDFNLQIVEMIDSKDGPLGFIRLTLDTHVTEEQAKQAQDTTNMIRLMLALATIIGLILAYTLLAHHRPSWKQSLQLLTTGECDEAPREDAAKELEPIKSDKKKRPHKKKPYR